MLAGILTIAATDVPQDFYYSKNARLPNPQAVLTGAVDSGSPKSFNLTAPSTNSHTAHVQLYPIHGKDDWFPLYPGQSQEFRTNGNAAILRVRVKGTAGNIIHGGINSN
jgi:hypothetical protein